MLFSLNASSQINRLYFNFGYGYPRHWEANATVHFMNYFSANFHYGTSSVPTSHYYTSYHFGLGFDKPYKDKYTYTGFFVGGTTRSRGAVNASLMAGYSHLNAKDYFNFHDTTNYFGDTWETHDVRYPSANSLTIRFDLAIALSTSVGLNLGIMQNFNKIDNTFSACLGLNIGLIRERRESDNTIH